MSRKHPHAFATFQVGANLVGFLAGLVLATMIIIAVLLMLNSNSKRDFKQPQPVTTNTPQSLTPNQNTSASMTHDEANDPATVNAIDHGTTAPSAPVSQPVPPTDTIADDTNQTQPADDPMTNQPIDSIPMENTSPPSTTPIRPNHQLTKNQNNNRSGSLKEEDLNIPEVDTPRKNPPSKIKPSVSPSRTNTPLDNKSSLPNPPSTTTVAPPKTVPSTPIKPTETPKVDTPKEPDTSTIIKPPVRKPPVVNTPPKKDIEVKPTAQQILDSGNIEKARELARKEASSKKAQVAKSESSSNNKRGSVVIQAGAFSSRQAAESQRARLALLGVQARVVEANVNGKSTYRVQTPRIEGSEANNARSVLQRHGVSTLERKE